MQFDNQKVQDFRERMVGERRGSVRAADRAGRPARPV
jgi:hypothetical protein